MNYMYTQPLTSTPSRKSIADSVCHIFLSLSNTHTHQRDYLQWYQCWKSSWDYGASPEISFMSAPQQPPGNREGGCHLHPVIIHDSDPDLEPYRNIMVYASAAALQEAVFPPATSRTCVAHPIWSSKYSPPTDSLGYTEEFHGHSWRFCSCFSVSTHCSINGGCILLLYRRVFVRNEHQEGIYSGELKVSRKKICPVDTHTMK